MKIILVLLSFAGCALLAQRACAQSIMPEDQEKLHIMEDSLLVTADSMYDALIPDMRVGYSERFVRQLIHALKLPNSYYYRFDSLSKVINIIYADDNGFRIFNWEITSSPTSKRYYGAIQMPGEKLKLIGLNDYSTELAHGAEDSILDNRKWFGGIIYRILSVDYQGHKLYNIFSFNQSALLSNRKVIDPMQFEGNGVRFGAPIFGVASESFPRQRINRFIIEYKKDVQASMNWDDEKKVIIFDKLVSQVNDPHRKYTYAPSGQYDGFRWENDTWNYIQDLIPVQILHDGEAPSDPPTGEPKR